MENLAVFPPALVPTPRPFVFIIKFMDPSYVDGVWECWWRACNKWSKLKLFFWVFEKVDWNWSASKFISEMCHALFLLPHHGPPKISQWKIEKFVFNENVQKKKIMGKCDLNVAFGTPSLFKLMLYGWKERFEFVSFIIHSVPHRTCLSSHWWIFMPTVKVVASEHLLSFKMSTLWNLVVAESAAVNAFACETDVKGKAVECKYIMKIEKLIIQATFGWNDTLFSDIKTKRNKM